VDAIGFERLFLHQNNPLRGCTSVSPCTAEHRPIASLKESALGNSSLFKTDSEFYGHEVKGELVFRASGAVVGLMKSAELTFVSLQLDARTTERAFEFVLETVTGAGPS
jgi:hypothetical protein